MSEKDYYQLITHMKELRKFFYEKLGTRFKLGEIYKGSDKYSYFSIMPQAIKKKKLKYVIILNHEKQSFNICLSGQNKGVRKKYWELLKSSDCDKYHLVKSIDDSLSIVEHTMIAEADFNNKSFLFDNIEMEANDFIGTVNEWLEDVEQVSRNKL